MEALQAATELSVTEQFGAGFYSTYLATESGHYHHYSLL